MCPRPYKIFALFVRGMGDIDLENKTIRGVNNQMTIQDTMQASEEYARAMAISASTKVKSSLTILSLRCQILGSTSVE